MSRSYTSVTCLAAPLQRVLSTYVTAPNRGNRGEIGGILRGNFPDFSGHFGVDLASGRHPRAIPGPSQLSSSVSRPFRRNLKILTFSRFFGLSKTVFKGFRPGQLTFFQIHKLKLLVYGLSLYEVFIKILDLTGNLQSTLSFLVKPCFSFGAV